MIHRYRREHGIDLQRIAITKQQIEQFGLQDLTNPDPDVLSKLKEDRNADTFKKNNDGRLSQVEVDVLQVLDPEILKDLLVSNVERYFDKKIYNEVMMADRFSADHISGLVDFVYKKIMQRFRSSPANKPK